MQRKVFRVCGKPSTVMSDCVPVCVLGKRDLNFYTFIDTLTVIMFMDIGDIDNFFLQIAVSRAFIKHIQLHAKSKPRFTIACTIITVIMHAIPNHTLQLFNPIKMSEPVPFHTGSGIG